MIPSLFAPNRVSLEYETGNLGAYRHCRANRMKSHSSSVAPIRQKRYKIPFMRGNFLWPSLTRRHDEMMGKD